MKALHVVELERQPMIEGQPRERVEQLVLALAPTKPCAQ
jgi:hypothetical protein